MEKELQIILKNQFNKTLDTAEKFEIYQALMLFTKQKMQDMPKNIGERKLYYVSAEFLIGKLLSNNLINLGLFDETKELLNHYGYDLTEIEACK